MDKDRESQNTEPAWAVTATVTAVDAEAPFVDIIEFEIRLAGRDVARLAFRGADIATASDWDQLLSGTGFFRLRFWRDASRDACIIATGGSVRPMVVFTTGGAHFELPHGACREALEHAKREYGIIQRRRARED
jgi:hypothetical protein